ncbi:hypothetical protein BGZ60DRAFT_222027 [Tricladium varicosporioides]|nr:hypothetical protein BGZ60DRAFT_222027 [Hymenoscyphus varicosporioides]
MTDRRRVCRLAGDAYMRLCERDLKVWSRGFHWVYDESRSHTSIISRCPNYRYTTRSFLRGPESSERLSVLILSSLPGDKPSPHWQRSTIYVMLGTVPIVLISLCGVISAVGLGALINIAVKKKGPYLPQ